MPSIHSTATLLATSLLFSPHLLSSAAPVGIGINLPQWVTSLKEFGTMSDQILKLRSLELFGILGPLDNNAPPTTGPQRKPDQPAGDHVLLAKGLKARYLTREIADKADQPGFWPYGSQNPTHAFFCIEAGRKEIEKPGGEYFSENRAVCRKTNVLAS